MPFVISISGVSGSGKTTVANALKVLLGNTEIISFDDYPGDLLGRDYCEWSERGADANEWDLTPIVRDINLLMKKSPDYIIIDYPFGYANHEVGSFIDYAIWIDIPLDIALVRRIMRDYLRRSETRRPLRGDSLSALLSNLDFYMLRHRDTYVMHIRTVRRSADLVVDGMEDVGEIASDLLENINTEYTRS